MALPALISFFGASVKSGTSLRPGFYNEAMKEIMKRGHKIVVTSLVAVLTNLALATTKYFIGLAAHSPAITSDAANNFSDAMGGLITIIGTKLSQKPSDKTHPFGYGRIEYFTTAIVAFLVLYVGIDALRESLHSILHPVAPEFSSLSLWLVALALGVKLVLGLWLKKRGKAIPAPAITASGVDSLNDSILSLATLISALLAHFAHIDIGGWLGLIIAGFILKSGYDLIMEPLSMLLGERTDSALTDAVKQTIGEHKPVEGVYDLIINSYGENFSVGSAHIQIPDIMSARQIDELTRRITQSVWKKYRIVLTLGIYASNISDPVSKEIRQIVVLILKDYPDLIQMHGFYVDLRLHIVAFDLIFPFEAPSHQYRHEIKEKLQEKLPGYTFNITLDRDFSN